MSALTYKAAGVDIDAGDEAVSRIKDLARKTFTSQVLTGIGQFGGLFRLDPEGMVAPTLVASADGVGTKLKIAFMLNRHDTIGQDLVNHCVNDILVMGARPLFFLDYIAAGKLRPAVVEQIVTGLAKACLENQCALIGGETAEMPDFYADNEYDLAGFIVGLVDQARIIDGSRIRPGDAILGLASSGLHTNGYSLARAICFKKMGLRVDDYVPALHQTIGEALLTVHRSYAPTILSALKMIDIHGLAHITGGGLPGNVIRILPEQCQARIDHFSWETPGLFRFLQANGHVADEEMYRTFNMGIGLVVVLPPAQVSAFRQMAAPETVSEIGQIVSGAKEVKIV